MIVKEFTVTLKCGDKVKISIDDSAYRDAPPEEIARRRAHAQDVAWSILMRHAFEDGEITEGA